MSDNKTRNDILGILRFNFILNLSITILTVMLNNNNTESKCLCCLNNSGPSSLCSLKWNFQPKENRDFKFRQVDGRVFHTTNSTLATSTTGHGVDMRVTDGRKVHFGRIKNCKHRQHESLEDFTKNSAQTIRPCCSRPVRSSKNLSVEIMFSAASPARISQRGQGPMINELNAEVRGQHIQNISSRFHPKKQKRSIGRPKEIKTESKTESILHGYFPGTEAKLSSKSRPKSRLIYASDSGTTSIGAFRMHKHDRWKDWKEKLDSFNRSSADDSTDEIIDLDIRRRPQHHRHRHRLPHRHHHHHHQQHQQQQQQQKQQRQRQQHRHNKPPQTARPKLKDDSRNTGKGLHTHHHNHQQQQRQQKNIFQHKPPPENVGRIIVAGLFSLSTSSAEDEINAESILSSAHLAIKHINANRSILPHHHLELHWNDTKCDMAIATRILFEMMHFKPSTAILFGDSCSRVTVPIAETAVWWNLAQLSYGDTNPVLSDREKYPNFFRTVPSDTDFNAARINFLQHFKWSRVATIYQDASTGNSRHSLIHEKLTGLLDQLNMDRETDSFSADPSTALQHIKDKDLRIILGDFNETMAKIVFCGAHNHDLYGPKYTWILGGSFRDKWWIRQDTGLPPCPLDDLLAALQGHITTDISVLSSSDAVTISGLTTSQYLKQHKISASNRSPGKYHGYAYDGVWAVALAIHALLRGRGGSPPIEEEMFRGERFRALLNNTDFVGVTGRVTFRRGDRVGNIVFKQFQDDKMVDIGEVDLFTGSLKFNGRLTWPGGDPPRDSSHVSLELQAVNLVLHLSVSLLAAVGIVISILFLFVNIRYREHAYIKMSSPNMNNLILVGCILAYFSVFLQGLNTRLVGEQLFSVICSLKVWVFSLGFTLSFGAMFSKTWRVHSIFTNISMNKKAIKDSKLVVMVNLLLLVDFVILVSWQVVDPPILQTRNITSVEQPPISSADTDVIFFIELCACKYMTTYLIIIYLYKGFLLVVGCFLAWETRSVTMTALNDSKYIGMSVYIVVITCVSVVPVNFLVSDKPDATYLLVSLFIIFGTTVTLCLVFGPKLVEIRRDPSGKKRQMLKSIAKTNKQNSERDFIKIQMTNKLLLENKQLKDLLDAMTRDQSKLERLMLDERSSTLSSPTSSTNEESVNLMRRSLLSQQQPHQPMQQHKIHVGDVVIESKQGQTEGNEFQPFLQQQQQHQQKLHQQKRCLRMNGFNEETSTVTGRKKSLIRTPSYQGLKFIAELDLKETDILSDCSDSFEEKDLNAKNINMI